MSESTDRKRRATGVWAMEQAADARFLPALDRLLKESGNDEPLKRRALAAVESIARREAELNAAPEVRLAAWARGGAGGNHIRLAVSPVQSASQPRIPAVDLRLSQGGFAVLDYTLAELAEEQHRSVAIVVPEGAAGLEKALLECLRFKQRDDSWAIVRYRSKGEASSESVWYVSRAPSVESVIRDTTRAGGGGAARAALRAIRNGQPRQRHLALLVAGEPGSEQPGAAETAELTGMARMTDAAIHTFAPPGCSASVRGWLQELARTCHGSFDEAAGDDLASTLPPACLRCRPRFDVRFSPVERSSFLKLELRSPSARGEVSVPLPR